MICRETGLNKAQYLTLSFIWGDWGNMPLRMPVCAQTTCRKNSVEPGLFLYIRGATSDAKANLYAYAMQSMRSVDAAASYTALFL